MLIIKECFTDQNLNLLEIEYKMKITLDIN